jgi:hypothetical protein
MAINTNISHRFSLVENELKKRGVISTRKELAFALDTYNHVILEIRKLKRMLTIKQAQLLTKTYGVNMNFIFGRSDIMFLSDIKPTFIPPVKPKKTYEEQMQEEKTAIGNWIMKGGLNEIKELQCKQR